jgi:hypothetical protein
VVLVVERDVTVHLRGGACVKGRFHVPRGASTVVRPSDAVRDLTAGYLLLSKVTVLEHQETRQASAVMIPREAVSYIEIPDKRWIVPTDDQRT